MPLRFNSNRLVARAARVLSRLAGLVGSRDLHVIFSSLGRPEAKRSWVWTLCLRENIERPRCDIQTTMMPMNSSHSRALRIQGGTRIHLYVSSQYSKSLHPQRRCSLIQSSTLTNPKST